MGRNKYILDKHGALVGKTSLGSYGDDQQKLQHEDKTLFL